ncbi:MAG TPA: hypothetical protein PL110_13790, partial [Candidatus Eremiobacteraeota bacterium]|nr:hypothetical protein [Candidatus Eremiobacteraeota bacterium]
MYKQIEEKLKNQFNIDLPSDIKPDIRKLLFDLLNENEKLRIEKEEFIKYKELNQKVITEKLQSINLVENDGQRLSRVNEIYKEEDDFIEEEDDFTEEEDDFTEEED